KSKSNGVTGPLPPSRDPVVISPPRLVLRQLETATILQRTAEALESAPFSNLGTRETSLFHQEFYFQSSKDSSVSSMIAEERYAATVREGVNLGNSPPKKKRKYLRNDDRLQRLCERFPEYVDEDGDEDDEEEDVNQLPKAEAIASHDGLR
ncbi:unnamed protein product, partial [Cyprideis torosa]